MLYPDGDAGTGVGHPDVVKEGVGDGVGVLEAMTAGTGLGRLTPGGRTIPWNIFLASSGA